MTFTPAAGITTDGRRFISWSNDGEKQNPSTLYWSDGTKGDTGEKGADGAAGVTFTPTVTTDASASPKAYTMTWSNDGGKENPAAVTWHDGADGSGGGGWFAPKSGKMSGSPVASVSGSYSLVYGVVSVTYEAYIYDSTSKTYSWGASTVTTVTPIFPKTQSTRHASSGATMVISLSSRQNDSHVDVNMWVIVTPSASGLYCVAYLPASITDDVLKVTSVKLSISQITSLTQAVSDAGIPDPTADATQVDPVEGGSLT